jgi:broad specificity phosphatase PhoE
MKNDELLSAMKQMKMDSIILVRHSQPEIRPELPAVQWELSEIGRQRCIPLADKIRPFQPVEIVTSRELKAIQTGTIVAHLLKIPATIAADLHEHERDGMGLGSREIFEAKLKRFFDEPSRLVFGQESAGQALLRFSDAITEVLSHHPTGSVVIVAHATVIALWATSLIGGDPFAYWKGLGMPAYAVFSRPNLNFMEIVDHVS